jgi:hypothetical protein
VPGLTCWPGALMVATARAFRWGGTRHMWRSMT